MKVAISPADTCLKLPSYILKQMALAGHPQALKIWNDDDYREDAECYGWYPEDWGIERHDPMLCEAVTTMAPAKTTVVEIPDDEPYSIVHMNDREVVVLNKHLFV